MIVINSFDINHRSTGRVVTVYIFTKSGARVHVVSPPFKWNGLDVLEVERIDTGKRMVVTKSSLVLEDLHTTSRG